MLLLFEGRAVLLVRTLGGNRRNELTQTVRVYVHSVALAALNPKKVILIRTQLLLQLRLFLWRDLFLPDRHVRDSSLVIGHVYFLLN